MSEQSTNTTVKECRSCKHYVKAPNDLSGNQGSCHRYPPQLFVMNPAPGRISTASQFPPVMAAMSCGEWQSDLKRSMLDA